MAYLREGLPSKSWKTDMLSRPNNISWRPGRRKTAGGDELESKRGFSAPVWALIMTYLLPTPTHRESPHHAMQAGVSGRAISFHSSNPCPPHLYSMSFFLPAQHRTGCGSSAPASAPSPSVRSAKAWDPLVLRSCAVMSSVGSELICTPSAVRLTTHRRDSTACSCRMAFLQKPLRVSSTANSTRWEAFCSSSRIMSVPSSHPTSSRLSRVSSELILSAVFLRTGSM
mmetsp:Transcript_21157/g.53209  ORF Transcript_21157/g.53209 Transcript_21157/m.53209 type:complete len:227 (-) Transcript_21157:84-764(-)